RLVDRQQVGEALGQRQPPDGGQVGSAGAQHVEPVTLGLRGGVLVGEDVGAGRGQLERPDDAGGVAGVGGVVDAVEPVRRVGGDGVGGGHALGGPVAQRAAGDLVAVVAALVDRQVDADGVVRVAVGEPGPERVVDHVVGRAHHPGEVDTVEV